MEVSHQCGIHDEEGTCLFFLVANKTHSDIRQITKVAAERSIVEREKYLDRVCHYRAEQLVFVDESSVDRRTTYRGRAWSIVGTKAQRKAFFLRGRR
jgi:hypothetical protein